MQTLDLSVPTSVVDLPRLIEAVKKFGRSAKSPATLKVYCREWNVFQSWCREHGLVALPASPETVAMFIADRASRCVVSTITRRLTQSSCGTCHPSGAQWS